MTKPVEYNAELRKWKREDNTFSGLIYGDKTGVYVDGTVRLISNFLHVTEYDGHWLLRTTGWTMFLDKKEEVK